VNNLHIISLYKLHNKLKLRVTPVALVVSSVLRQSKCMGSTRRTCRVETWRAEWNLGYIGWLYYSAWLACQFWY